MQTESAGMPGADDSAAGSLERDGTERDGTERDGTETGGTETGGTETDGTETGGVGGSLRDRLVDTGVALVDARGAGALSLREIARAAGVSHGAPRRYFPTHLELLSAIARRGFADLGARAAEAVRDGDGGSGPGSARARLATLARVYLGFAADHRGMYELMFRHDLLESGTLGLRETSLPLFRMLTELVAAVHQDATRPGGGPAGGESAVVAGALWANLHGVAQLWGWGSLPLAVGHDAIEPLIIRVLDAHLGPVAS
ncbi:TetR/AcrR family transcriptional regulator [Streptomyces sp. NPDC049813]|uniref:TetR/AcrR family transcriptional regulator n=1 Tax=Streptomyces sp. NPDC049813 TaxID=3365597 RepID=UPI0037A39489